VEAGPATSSYGPHPPASSLVLEPGSHCAAGRRPPSGGCLLPAPAVRRVRAALSGGQRIATPAINEPRINERIRAREVRLVDADGKQLGIKPLPEALHTARLADLDLVEVAPQAAPPVCRIMDYGKYKFDEAQRAKESRRKATNVGIKEMKYRPKIGGGDFDTKTRQVGRFLGEGHKVKVTIMFRGREMSHPELGKKILDRVAENVAEVSKVELYPKLDGRNMIMVLAPDKRSQPKPKAASGAERAAGAPAPSSEGAPGAQDGAGPSADGVAVLADGQGGLHGGEVQSGEVQSRAVTSSDEATSSGVESDGVAKVGADRAGDVEQVAAMAATDAEASSEES
jgi:translation initiation factor IF-3